MNELRAIIEAFDEANARGERCALATVVSVEGSSYRLPGAKMLVCEGGMSSGTISAGCLESDVIEHAKRVIKTNLTKLVEYDTTSTSDEIVWGLGLGCNGIVRVLVGTTRPAVKLRRRATPFIRVTSGCRPHRRCDRVLSLVFKFNPNGSGN